MMKPSNIFIELLSLTLLLLTGCSEEDGRVKYPYSIPEMSDLRYSITDEAPAADSIYFSVKLHDLQTPLSTLEIKLISGEKVLSAQSIRTKGYDANIVERGVYIPFYAGLEDNQEAQLVLTAINVEGSEVTETLTFDIVRPEITEVIYLHYNDKVLEMTRSEDEPDVYYTEVSEEGYPMEFTGKISTEASIDDSKLIWGASETSNVADLIEKTGAGFTFDYRDWMINRIKFNVANFELGVEGSQKNLRIKGIQLNATTGLSQATINFTKGEEFDMTGFDDVENAYNRDFFGYNPENGKFTFLRESGDWEVYYSSKFNYIWVARMGDVAPDCFWLVGHGFTSAPVWNTFYDTSDGWSLVDITQLAYIIPIGGHKYQTTVYLSNTHKWESFEVEIYSNLNWSKDEGMELKEGAISGDINGISVSKSNGLTSAEGFVPGYYRLTFDTSLGVGKETLYIERLTN